MTEHTTQDDIERAHKSNWGGKRTPGTGKKLGKQAGVGTNPKNYIDYLDDETIAALKKVSKSRSEAIRILAKASRGRGLPLA